ncbi:MAG: hypothetical protein LBK68_01425 [Candidatus Margulisbacteria bacterium]|jgi:hypothetical protein|nr:hypothetical protein [Candidatus Margulisiibacteriota bacterium]
MSEQYHICLVAPQARPFYGLIFREIALLLIHTFNSLGHSCSLKTNQTTADRLNILLGWPNLIFSTLPQGHKYIPYQLEQLSSQEGWYVEIPGAKKFFQNAVELWDYSENNVEFLRTEHIPAKLLPLGYHEKLELLTPPDKNKDIDVLFYGGLNERRIKVLEQLQSRGVKVQVLSYDQSAFSGKRDEYIARTKIVLNIHYYETKIFEAARISYLLNNKVLVITEQSADNPYTAVDLISVPYEQLVDECLRRLADWDNSQKIAQLNYQQFKENYAMTKLLAKVI